MSVNIVSYNQYVQSKNFNCSKKCLNLKYIQSITNKFFPDNCKHYMYWVLYVHYRQWYIMIYWSQVSNDWIYWQLSLTVLSRSIDSTTCWHCLDWLTVQPVTKDLIFIQYHMSALSRSTDSTTCQYCPCLLTVPHVSIVWIYWQYNMSATSRSTDSATCQQHLGLLTVPHVSNI